jgi:release factor glutamine methyltransferase
MISAALEAATAALAAHSASARLDAEVLLAHVLGASRAELLVRGAEALAPAAAAAYAALLHRRAAGEPVAYLLGRREFWTLTLEVDATVLVPRPETELLVELALAALAPRDAGRVLDLGTGSGAVGLAIASERAAARVDLVDASAAALAVAERNRVRLGLGNARTVLGDWFGPVAGCRYALIVANPPYLAVDDPHLGDRALMHEPRTALVAGPSGLEAVAAIAAGARTHLEPGGWLIVEHGWTQGPQARELLARSGLEAVRTERDLAGTERATLGRAPG